MKKNTLFAAALVLSMGTTLLAGCGSAASSSEAAGAVSGSTATESTDEAVNTDSTAISKTDAEDDSETVVSGGTASESADAEASSEEVSEYSFRTEEMWLTNDDKNIYGIMYLPEEEAESYPTVILSHGFGGNVNNTIKYAEIFADQGYAAYVFDFCGGGEKSQSDGETTEMTVLTEADDLNAVIDQIQEVSYVNTDQIFLMGESQGAYVSAYVAAEREEDINALILYYPAFMLADRVTSELEEVDDDYETREFLGMEIGRVYDEALLETDIYGIIGGYTKDVLICHGTKDKLVPVSYAEKAVDIYNSAELYMVEGGNHGFWDEYMLDAADKTLEFLNAHIGE